MGKDTEKAKLYMYIGDSRDVATDFEGNRKRNEWVLVPGIELDVNESIKKLSWRADNWGSNNVVLQHQDFNRLVAKTMVICEAMFADKEQKDAFKQLLKDALHSWNDEMFHRYNLNIDAADTDGAEGDYTLKSKN